MLIRRPALSIRSLLRLTRRAAWPLHSLVASGLAFSALLVLASGLIAKDLHDGAERDVGRSLESLTTLLAEQADRSLQAIDSFETAMAGDLADQTVATEDRFKVRASAASIHDRLAAGLSGLPQAEMVLVLDAGGQVLASSRAWPVLGTGRTEPFFDLIARSGSDRSVTIEPSLPQGSTTPTVTIAHRMVTPGGIVLGFVLSQVNLHYFEDLYARVSPDDASVVSMVYETGIMLARHPAPPGAIGQPVPAVQGKLAWASGPMGPGIGRMITPIDGQDRFIAVQHLAHYPLIVGSSRTVDAAFAPWREQVLTLGVGVLLLIAGVCAVVWTGMRQIRGQKRLVRSEAARVAAEERARGDRLLRQDYARFGAALDSMSQGLCLFDAAHDLVVLNARFAAMYGVPDELRRPGTSLDRLLDHLQRVICVGDGPRFAAELRAAADQRRPATLTCELGDGRIVGVSSEPVADGGFVCTHEDETERRRSEATIVHMAHHDALTGLPNRLLFGAGTEHLLASPERRRHGALLLLDLDGFKQVNDVYGHPFGDALLRDVSGRLRDAIGPADLLSRLGGDEFAIVRHGSDQPADAMALAGRLVEALRLPFVIDGTTVSIGTSIGVALPDEAAGSSELLLRNADIALYRAKAAGRGASCLYEAQMEREIRSRRALERDLANALARGEFELHYQAIVEAGGDVMGFEALLRWRHPVRGVVPPSDFITVAEETGVIREIGMWVLTRACMDAATWPDTLTVAVNLSPAQFREGRLLARVGEALALSGLAAHRLELEITESVLLRDDHDNLAVLRELHRMGVRIAMDDFGTGYSSLNYLRRFPFDKIKIDQSFVRELFDSPENIAIVRAAIELGHALGMTVLAEGVETMEERFMLIAEGCDQLQGFVFGRPKPIAELVMPADRAAA